MGTGKIYTLVGTHSTGKSTLIAELQKIYPAFKFFHSTTRGSTTVDERRLEKVTDETQRKIYSAILEREKEILEISKSQTVFMDRSFLDFTAYTLAFRDLGEVSTEFAMHVLSEYRARVASGMYTKIFYLPVEFSIVDDGIRNVNVNLQSKVDGIIQTLLLDFDEQGRPVVNKNLVVLRGTVEDRLETLKEFIYYESR